MNRRALVLGGGIGGLSSGVRLLENGWSVDLLEKTGQVGGLGRSFVRNGCVFDIGIHALYQSNKETKVLVDHYNGKIAEHLVKVYKKTSLWFFGKYLQYPLKTTDLFFAMSLYRNVRCFSDFLYARVKKRMGLMRDDGSFEQWVVNRFGRTLYNTYFGPYVEKVWGVPARQMSSKWLARRISQVSLWSLIKKTLGNMFRRHPSEDEMQSLQPKTFMYSRKGNQVLQDWFLRRFQELGGQLHLQSRATSLRLSGRRVVAATAEIAGATRDLPVDAVVNTITIPQLAALLTPDPGGSVVAAGKGLRYRALVLVHLFCNRDRVFNDQWVYYQDRRLPFNRVNEYKNVIPDMATPGKTAVQLEITCFEGDDTWRAKDQELVDKCIGSLEWLKIMKREEVTDWFVERIENSYPVFDIPAEQNLDTFLDWVDASENLRTIGRQGRFQYINQDEVIFQAEAAVDALSGKSTVEVGRAPKTY
jgi:protoporphyrinogen oxidase